MIDRHVPGGRRNAAGRHPQHYEKQLRLTGQDKQREKVARVLQGELFDTMVIEAANFADAMRVEAARTDVARVSCQVPRKIPLLGTKIESYEESYWLIRGSDKTNYGGFPLFFGAGNRRDREAFQRIVVAEDGKIKMFISFGDAVTPQRDIVIHSETAKPDHVIYHWALKSQQDQDALHNEWQRDLSATARAYSGMEGQQNAPEHKVVAFIRGQRIGRPD